MASSRFVLPSPLAPTITVSPSAGASSTEVYDRKSVSQRRRSRMRSAHPDGHEQVQVVLRLDRADDSRLERVDGLEADLVAVDCLDAVEQEVGVERDRHLGALVLGIEV